MIPRLRAALLAAALVVLALPARADETREERNKAVAMRVFEENFNQGRFAVADEIYAPDFVNHGLHRNADLKEDQDAVHEEKLAFPDLEMTVDMLVAEGDLVTAVWTFRGTHTHDGYGGLPATGARIEMRGITVWRIIDGKIRDEWTSFDDLGAYLQMLRQVKGWLVGLGLALVIAVIAIERGLVWGVRAILRRVRSSRWSFR
jgi:steroid delta-isomerase-like uncharacterized protein